MSVYHTFANKWSDQCKWCNDYIDDLDDPDGSGTILGTNCGTTLGPLWDHILLPFLNSFPESDSTLEAPASLDASGWLKVNFLSFAGLFGILACWLIWQSGKLEQKGPLPSPSQQCPFKMYDGCSSPVQWTNVPTNILLSHVNEDYDDHHHS